MDSTPKGILPPAVVWAGLVLIVLSGTVQAGAPYRFDDSGYLGAAELMPDWADTMARQQAQSATLEACLLYVETCPGYYRGLRHVLLKAAALPRDRQVFVVNRYVNRKRYRNDRTAELETELADEPQKYRSRWSTVEEFMRRGGDCEDFATTKYYLLRQLGFDPDELRIVVTWDRDARGYHAVLAVRDQGKIKLLESNNEIRRAYRHGYRFIYSVNEKSIWDHQAPPAVSQQTQPEKENSA